MPGKRKDLRRADGLCTVGFRVRAEWRKAWFSCSLLGDDTTGIASVASMSETRSRLTPRDSTVTRRRGEAAPFGEAASWGREAVARPR